ncbi:MAG TPA: trehalose-phosphatase [Steroidobacteraceae bacterium]|nr:trehalose-phosphatase [Steroidobacteraceae bacterium]
MKDRNADEATLPRLGEPPLPATPACLFLDVDGTLVEFALRPDGVAVDETLIRLLRGALRVTRGALAFVSGRPVAQLDRLFAPLRLPTAGVHGCERRDASGAWHRTADPDARLIEARNMLESLTPPTSGVFIEDKGSALAVHYRSAPQWKSRVRAVMSRLAQTLLPDYELLDGNAVFELKLRSCSKAAAIEAFLAEAPFAGRTPVFLGDDATDCDGFEAVRGHGGIAIAVGDRVSADWRLADPHAVRSWLQRFVEHCGAAS